MSLADWLQDGRGLGERLEALENLCGALDKFHTGRRANTRPALNPAQIEIGSDGEIRLVPADDAPDQQPVPEYRAPELIDNLVPYERGADIYSIGVLAYELLAGRHPFVVPTPLGSIEAAANVPPPALADVAKDLPRDLAEAVMPCLERDPEWRPKDLSYLLETVRKARRQHPAPRRRAAAKAPARPAAASAPERVAPGAAPAARPPAARAGGSAGRAPLIAASVGGMLVLLGGVWWLTRPPSGPESATTSPRAVATPVPVTASAQPTPDAPSRPLAASPAATTASPTPAPLASPTPTPVPTPSAAPSTAPATTVRATPVAPVPVESAPALAASPTPVPELARTAAAVPPPGTTATEPAGPAVITALVPAKLRKGATVLVDVRGSGLRPGLQPRLAFRGREPAQGVQVVGQRFVNPTLLTLLIKIDDQAREGNYLVMLTDAQGNASNARPFDVGR